MKEWVKYLFPLLIGLLVFGIFKCQSNRIEELERQLDKTTEGVGNLAENVVFQSVLDKNLLTITERLDGTDTVTVETVYVPVESEVTHTVELDTLALSELEQAQELLAELEGDMESSADTLQVQELRESIEILRRRLYITKVDFQRRGFCLEPCVVGGVNTTLESVYGGGVRLFYWNRWGIGLQASTDSESNSLVGLFGDYRIPKYEEFAPYGSFDYDINREQVRIGIGLHWYF